MNKDIALQLALKALKADMAWLETDAPTEIWEKNNEAITAIKEALETEKGLLDRKSYLLGLYDQKSRLELETKDEPVAWEQFYPDIGKPQIAFNAEVVGYDAPQRTWVGLTDEEKAQFVVAYYPSNWDRKTAVSLMNDYEKYLKEKNNV